MTFGEYRLPNVLKECADAAQTPEDRAAIRRLRLDPEKYLATKQERMK